MMAKQLRQRNAKKAINLMEVNKETDKRLMETDNSTVSRKRRHISVKSFNEDAKPLWQEHLHNLRIMRNKFDAPVDSMGPVSASDENASDHVIRYQRLVSLMLSSQTKDNVNYEAMQKLKEHGCTMETIAATDEQTIGKLIYPVSFWKTKAKHIKKATDIMLSEYKGDIPDSVDGLCRLPGVGPKMAHICMKVAWGQVTGIGVDTHVHRIANRLAWVSNTKNPQETRVQLEQLLPKDLWDEVNLLLVGFGQQICKAVNPMCGKCLNRDICSFPRS